MMTGYDVWKHFDALQISEKEYANLARRLELLKRDLQSHIAQFDAGEVADAIDSIEIDLAVSYFGDSGKEQEVTPWIRHAIGVSTLGLDELPSILKPIFKSIADAARPKSTQEFLVRIKALVCIIMDILNIIDSAREQTICVSALHVLDVAILELVCVINVFRLSDGLKSRFFVRTFPTRNQCA